jgi:ABC-2 type transport system ATP-binding protein
MSMSAAIVTRGLVKRYGEHLAVSDISLEVERGEIFAMIGPNGAGKSTTIRMILDIIKPDVGQIEVLGGPLTEASKNRIGYLPEERGLYKNVPLLNLLSYLGQLKGMSKADASSRAKALLEKLELGEYLKKNVTALSKGMAQKVQFIATILHRPDLIIIDEPFSGLDPVNTQVLKDLLYESVQEVGTAVVMSTHQMQQLQEMAGRMLMIAKGQRVLYGHVSAIRQQYAQNAVFVAGTGDWAAIEGVKRVDSEARKGEALLYLDDHTTPDQLMQRLAASPAQVQRFELAIPSLEEIFIRVAGDVGAYQHLGKRVSADD